MARVAARLLALLLILLPPIAAAEPFPAPADPYVTDLSGVLPPEDRDRLRGALASLREETGIEAAVVTIPSLSDYDGANALEPFATGLFNAWGIGNAARNDGILILVVTDDRAMRLELGSGYNQGYDVLAQDIVNRYFLPEFRDGQIARGITGGTEETIARIARRHAQSLPAEALPPEASRGFPWLPAGLFGAGALFLAFRRRIADASYAFRRCPNCGHTGLTRLRGTPSEGETGAAIDRVRCRHCDWHEDREVRTRAPKAERSRDGFGGCSSGGGASGRW